MAIFHLNAKTIGRSQGRSATGAAAYRAGVRIADIRTGLVFDYTRKRGVDGSEIIVPDGTSLERAVLWNAVEHSEKRVDAQLAREIEVALPRELTPEQMRTLVREFVREQFVAIGMVADIAFHHVTGANPHAHILLTLREWRDGAFGLKRREWNDRSLCERWRTAWADHANAALADAGHAARIDPRTLVEQAADAQANGRHDEAIALDRIPTIHERGNRAAIAHNAEVRQGNSTRLAEWAAIEEAAGPKGRLMTAARDAAPQTRAQKLAGADAEFSTSIRQRRDKTGSRWRYYDDRVLAATDWLRNHAGGDTRRFKERDRSALTLLVAREKQRAWVSEHAKPPFWRFWDRPSWSRDRALVQAQVDLAKRDAARADYRTSTRAINKWRQNYVDQQAERDHALRERRALALLPSEQIEAEREREALVAAAPKRRGLGIRRQLAPPEVIPPPRPRPGRRR